MLKRECSDWFFVTGSPRVVNGDMDMNENVADTQNILKNKDGKNLLPVGDDSLYAAILLHTKGTRELSDINLLRNPTEHISLC